MLILRDYREASRYLVDLTGPDAHGLSCYFGSFGNQTKLELKPLESINLCTLLSPLFIPGLLTNMDSAEKLLQNNSHVFNAGGPIWGLDWCPIHANDRESRGISLIC